MNAKGVLGPEDHEDTQLIRNTFRADRIMRVCEAADTQVEQKKKHDQKDQKKDKPTETLQTKLHHQVIFDT